MAALRETVVLRDPASGAPVALLAGSEAPDWALERISPDLLDSDSGSIADMTVKQLKEYAAGHEIDIAGLKSKADSLQAIEAFDAEQDDAPTEDEDDELAEGDSSDDD